MLVGLMAVRTDKIVVEFKILKFSTDCIVRIFTAYNKGTPQKWDAKFLRVDPYY